MPLPGGRPQPSNTFSSTGVIASANRIEGKASVISIVRDRTRSVFPPKKPEIKPTVIPIIVAKRVALNAIVREVRAPKTNRRNTSRPVLGSTPNQCIPDTPPNLPSGFVPKSGSNVSG